MKTGRVVAIVAVIAILALALGVTIGVSISSGKTSTPYIVISNLYIHGQTARLFLCQGLPDVLCVAVNNETSVAVQLIEFRGNDYYLGNITLNDVVYQVWFNNSTIICANPKVSDVDICHS